MHEHYVRCVPFRMTIGLFDEVDPGMSIADFYGIGHSSDVTSHTAGFRRLVFATYHAVRAVRRQQGLQDCGHALGTARAVAAAHAREVCGFWPHPCHRRDTGALRRPVRDWPDPPASIEITETPTHVQKYLSTCTHRYT